MMLLARLFEFKSKFKIKTHFLSHTGPTDNTGLVATTLNSTDLKYFHHYRKFQSLKVP